MAKLHEMRWGAMHKQTMSHQSRRTQELTQTLGFHARRNKMHKQTDVKRKRKGRGGVAATGGAADRAFMSSVKQAGTSLGCPVCKAFWELSGTQNEVKNRGRK